MDKGIRWKKKPADSRSLIAKLLVTFESQIFFVSLDYKNRMEKITKKKSMMIVFLVESLRIETRGRE